MELLSLIRGEKPAITVDRLILISPFRETKTEAGGDEAERPTTLMGRNV